MKRFWLASRSAVALSLMTLSMMAPLMIALLIALLMALLMALPMALPMTSAWAHPGHQRPEAPDPEEEAWIHTPAGFADAGQPASEPPEDAGTLAVSVVDSETGEPTFCRVNVVGADGQYYEPAENPLAPWSLAKLGNRAGKGPIRYYGWFFYTSGAFSVRVPAGATRIEVWKGYEHRPQTSVTQVAAGAKRNLRMTLRRASPMAAERYYSGDTHIHLNRRQDEDDQRALDLLEAEDVRYGYVLCMNDPRTYTGAMVRQEWPQDHGLGAASVRARGGYQLASGQEYRCGTYGHICLLMHNKLVLEGLTVDPNNWPVFGVVAEETRKLGGYSFHAHGGYSQEIYADFAQRATDGVELLQFAEYRGIALEGWYRMLSVGYRFPAVGASDYPYCRAFGDCRTYVHADEPPDSAGWARAAAEGRSFFTTGPLLRLEVDGRPPGATLERHGAGPHALTARVRVRCEVAPVTHVELIANGASVAQLEAPASRPGDDLELEHELELSESTWIAARAWSQSPTGKPDAEAHTNPVYVYLDGKKPFRADDLEWLLERLDGRIAELKERKFAEQPMAVKFFERSRARLLELKPGKR